MGWMQTYDTVCINNVKKIQGTAHKNGLNGFSFQFIIWKNPG